MPVELRPKPISAPDWTESVPYQDGPSWLENAAVWLLAFGIVAGLLIAAQVISLCLRSAEVLGVE
jgi:hypothetical protein